MSSNVHITSLNKNAWTVHKYIYVHYEFSIISWNIVSSIDYLGWTEHFQGGDFNLEQSENFILQLKCIMLNINLKDISRFTMILLTQYKLQYVSVSKCVIVLPI